MRKSLWSPDEDEKLRRYVAIHGCGNWSDVAKQTGLKRCGKSCRLRWINYLRPELKRGPFSVDEVRLVVSLHQHLGNGWSKIATHLPGRTDNDVKNFWHCYTRSQRMEQQQRHQHRHRQSAEKINAPSRLDITNNESPASNIIEVNQEATYNKCQDYDQPLLNSCSSIDLSNKFIVKHKDVVKSPGNLPHNHYVYHQAIVGPSSTLHPSSSSSPRTNFIKPPHPNSPDTPDDCGMELLFMQEANILKHTPYMDLKPIITAKAAHPPNTPPPSPTAFYPSVDPHPPNTPPPLPTAFYPSVDPGKQSSELQAKQNTTYPSQGSAHQIYMPSGLPLGNKAAHCRTAISPLIPPEHPMNDITSALNPQETRFWQLLQMPADGAPIEELVDKQTRPEGLQSVVWSFIPHSPDSFFPVHSPASFPTQSAVHHYYEKLNIPSSPPSAIYPHHYLLQDQYSIESLSDCAIFHAQLGG